MGGGELGGGGYLVGLERSKAHNYYRLRLFINIETLSGMCLETF